MKHIKDRSLDDATVVMLAHDISRLFHNQMRNELSKQNINHSYHRLLFHLSNNDSLTQLDLVKFTHLKAPSISVTLQKMEYDGLITRETNPSDMRQVIIRITDKGRQLNETVRTILQEQDKMCMDGITDEEIGAAKKVLDKMIHNLIGQNEKGMIR